ncbi:MAG: hypothetical protein ACRC5C_06455 [Bacilli bacterium]
MLKKLNWAERLCVGYALLMLVVGIQQIIIKAPLLETLAAFSGIPLGLIPLWIQRYFKKPFEPILIFWYLAFLLGAQYFGTVLHFYRMFFWDMLMHGLAGVLLGFGGIYLLEVITKKETLAQLSSAHVFWFVKGFGVFGGVMWEVYEFLGDEIFQTTMQGGGNRDTMTDLCCDIIGSYIVAYWYTQKHKRRYGR